MQEQRFRRIKDLFHRAVDLPDAERAALLDRECGGDSDLRAEVERLLAIPSEAGEKEGGESSRPPTDGPTLTREDGRHEFRRDVGPYHLLQKLGEGGMGEVWLAEQTSPVHRRVALKLIKAGADTKHIVARFQAERQALALMQHPSIAKILDAGETHEGRPYFVMEYVPGEPITVCCDRNRMTTVERLRLLLPVCDAVQHAHQKGVIHRDLKPSNVLVTIQDDKPVPKIIDFGVAKATSQRLTEATLFTELGVLIGTPEYMSPEQAALSGVDVDTRTDVYSLGVLLYELLTGVLPFEIQELRVAGLDEIRRKIREDDPPRPSTRVGSLGERATKAAAERRTDPGHLASGLRGDLDWIVMKALEKDRGRRYGSAAELAADLERHLNHLPVVAGPPSARYRAGKFIRRHRLGVTAASAIAIALVAGAALATVGLVRARRAEVHAKQEAAAARRVSDFLTGLFQVSDPSEARGNTITAREVLDKGIDGIEQELKHQPEIQARLMDTMGNVYVGLGLMGRAELLLKRALEIRSRVLGEDHPDTLSSMSNLEGAYLGEGRYVEAEKLARETLERRRRVLGEDHPDTLRSMASLAGTYRFQFRYPEAEKLDRETFEKQRRVLGEDHPDTLASMNALAGAYAAQGRHAEAEKAYGEVLEKRRRILGENDPGTIDVMNNLAGEYQAEGRYAEAEKLFIETLERRRRVQGTDHPSTFWAMYNLAGVYMNQDRYVEAEKLYREVFERQRRLQGEGHPDTLAFLGNVAWALMAQGRTREAEKIYLETIERAQKSLWERHPIIFNTFFNLACLAAKRGDHRLALDRLRQSVDHGFRNGDVMEKDDDLKVLHGRPEFAQLVAAARRNRAKPMR